MSKPRLLTANELPSRVPITAGSVQSEDTTKGGSDKMQPTDMPYKHEKTMQPAVVVIEIHEKVSTMATRTAGIMTLSPPILSASMFGAMRPKIEQAFKIGSR